jgi:hypothetical protein
MVVISVLELFPEANEVEISETKLLLSRYVRLKKVVQELEGQEILSPIQQIKYMKTKQTIESLERAIRLIKDDDIRKMIEMRYIKDIRHKFVLHRFSEIHQTTVDRWMNEGIKSIANTLKDIG